MKGIYKITNKINNKIYIGQSSNIYLRWGQHIQQITINDKYKLDRPLYSDMRQQGYQDFAFEVVELLDNATEEMLLERENHHIECFNSIEPAGYNGIVFGHSKISQTVYEFDLLGAPIQEFDSIKDAAELYKVHVKTIQLAIREERRVVVSNSIFSYDREDRKPVIVDLREYYGIIFKSKAYFVREILKLELNSRQIDDYVRSINRFYEFEKVKGYSFKINGLSRNLQFI